MNIREQLETFVESVAREIAAKKMKLVKDVHGENIPYDLWKSCIPEARKFLNLDLQKLCILQKKILKCVLQKI